MLGRFFLRIAGKLVARPIARRIKAFEQATHYPEKVQSELLFSILRYHTDTDYARDHGFATIRTLADYRRQIPVAPYEYIAKYVDRLKKGDTRALLADPQVLMFALTSGTTASRKHIPITKQYLDDYRRGWNIWGLTALRDHKPIVLRPMMQLAGDPDEYRTEADIPCGNLSGFTAQVQKKIIRFLYSVPAVTARIKDTPTRYYVALRYSIPRKVGMLISANPSTLVGLARIMDRDKDKLLKDIREGTLSADLDIPGDIRSILSAKLKPDPQRANEIAAIASRKGVLLPSDVWNPEKLLLGCWTGGSVGPYLRQLQQFYGNTPVRDLGLLASEGRMTIPLEDATPSGVLDITTHFFEFIPEGEIDSPQPTVLAAHEVKEGQSYYILPTTKAGLYRYHISDLVKVTGFFNNTPMIQFLGKGNRFANLTGEKLSEHQVTQAMEVTVRQRPYSMATYALAPCWDDMQPYYSIFLEEQDTQDEGLLRDFIHLFDKALGEQNIEYAAKRESGRLGMLQVMVIPSGAWLVWDRARLAKNGGSPEQYKHPCLIGDVNFRNEMNIRKNITYRT